MWFVYETCFSSIKPEQGVFNQISTSHSCCFKLYALVSDASKALDDATEAAIAALSRLLLRRLAIMPPSPTLVVFLLHTLTSVDPDLYHCAARRAFDERPNKTASGINLIELARNHLQSLRHVVLTPNHGTILAPKQSRLHLFMDTFTLKPFLVFLLQISSVMCSTMDKRCKNYTSTRPQGLIIFPIKL